MARDMEKRRAYQKKWREEHADHVRAYQREYARKKYQENPEKFRQLSREYKEKNRDKVRAYNKKYREDNIDAIRKRERDYHKRYRELHRAEHNASSARQRQKFPNETKVRSMANHAIRDGKLTRQPCEVCGEKQTQAHHDDYNNPLEVRWLCVKCHNEWHRYNKPIRVGERK